MVVHVRPTAGLLLLFTLLTLINLSSSLLDKENMAILQEYFQGGIEEAAKKKAQLKNVLTLVENYNEEQFEEIYPILRQLIAVTDRSTLLRDLKGVVIKFLAQKKTDSAKGKKILENEIEEIWDIVELLEYNRDEL